MKNRIPVHFDYMIFVYLVKRNKSQEIVFLKIQISLKHMKEELQVLQIKYRLYLKSYE